MELLVFLVLIAYFILVRMTLSVEGVIHVSILSAVGVLSVTRQLLQHFRGGH